MSVHLACYMLAEFNAFFYTLISTDTMEVFFSNKRRRYLVDQGYAYKTITSVPHIRKTEMDLREGCPFMVDPEERLEVLQKVLTSDVRKTEEKENDVYASFQSGLECCKWYLFAPLLTNNKKCPRQS